MPHLSMLLTEDSWIKKLISDTYSLFELGRVFYVFINLITDFTNIH